MLIAPARVLVGVVVPLVRRHRAIARGVRPTALRSAIAVGNGVVVGVVFGSLLELVAIVAGSQLT